MTTPADSTSLPNTEPFEDAAIREARFLLENYAPGKVGTPQGDEEIKAFIAGARFAKKHLDPTEQPKDERCVYDNGVYVCNRPKDDLMHRDGLHHDFKQANGPVFDSDEKMNEIRAILANFGTAPAGNPNEYAAWIGMEELLTRIREVLP